MKKRRAHRRRAEMSERFMNRRFEAAPEIIYSTIRDSSRATRNLNSFSAATKNCSNRDDISITLEDIESMERDPVFIKEPIAYLKRLGMSESELRTLMKHPNFVDDPLAALKPVKLAESPKEKIRDKQTLNSISE